MPAKTPLNSQYWPPMFGAFDTVTKGGQPAIKLTMNYPDASITQDDDHPTVLVRTADELRNDVQALRRDIENQFGGNLAPADDPDVQLLTNALDALENNQLA